MLQETAILEWYATAGVDEAIDDLPRNWFVVSPIQTPTKPQIIQDIKPAPAIVISNSLTETITQAKLIADRANTLAELQEAIKNFDGCAIKKTATNTVFADGNPQAKLMLIGEAPGADEDIKGIPFCGVSGKLLDKMFAAIGYDRTSFYITNTLFWRPPGNRQPSSEELEICKPFVDKHIALIDPELLVLVGGVAAKSLLNNELGITKLRGKDYIYKNPYNNKEYQTTIIYHPSYLLRQPSNKRVTWQDLLAIKSKLNE